MCAAYQMGKAGGFRLVDLYFNNTGFDIRSLPATKHELISAGLKAEDFKEYINLIKKLYGALFASTYGRMQEYGDPTHAMRSLWKQIVDCCIYCKMIPEFVYPTGERMYPDIPSSVSCFQFIYQYAEIQDDVYVATYDDFRGTVEMALAGVNDECHLRKRYGISIDNSNKYHVAVQKIDFASGQKTLPTLEEMLHVCHQIDADIDYVSIQAQIHLNNAPPPPATESKKEMDEYIQKRRDWLDIRVSYERALNRLNACKSIMDDLLDHDLVLQQTDMTSMKTNAEEDQTLYVHKGQIVCIKHHHMIEQATAVLKDLSGHEIHLNVSHCIKCNKFFIHYDIYKKYREQYGVILGDIQMMKTGHFDEKAAELSEESTLHLCGYNVSQKNGLSSVDRHTIIAAVIENGAMTKDAIINLLNYLIELNSSKSQLHHAIQKWTEDICFTLAYNTNNQKHYPIKEIVPYCRNRFIHSQKASVSSSKTGTQHKQSLIGKKVLHSNTKFGYGVVIDEDENNVTLKFDNGEYSVFSKTIFSKGYAKILNDLSHSPSLNIPEPMTSSVFNSAHISSMKKENENCHFAHYSTSQQHYICTNSDAPRYSKRCVMCIHFEKK